MTEEWPAYIICNGVRCPIVTLNGWLRPVGMGPIELDAYADSDSDDDLLLAMQGRAKAAQERRPSSPPLLDPDDRREKQIKGGRIGGVLRASRLSLDWVRGAEEASCIPPEEKEE